VGAVQRLTEVATKLGGPSVADGFQQNLEVRRHIWIVGVREPLQLKAVHHGDQATGYGLCGGVLGQRSVFDGLVQGKPDASCRTVMVFA
jgi:hypothetical protein